MRTQSQLGEDLLSALSEISALLEKGRQIALDEQEALVANDAELLVKACKAQEDILRRIGEADQRAAESAGRLAESAGLDPNTADAASVAEASGLMYADQIRREIAHISKLAAILREEHETNRLLLQNGLDIVACCLRTLACDQGPNSYSNDAALNGCEPMVLSLDIRA